LFLAPRGEHEDSHVARGWLCAQLLEHIVAGRTGEHQVEHDEGRPLLARRGQRVWAGGCRRHAVAGFHEMVGDEGDDVRLVVDDEHALAGDGRRGSHDHEGAAVAMAALSRR
jgi:hypothetical protein